MKVVPLLIKNLWEEKELYPADKSIFACQCGSFDIENDAYTQLSSLLQSYTTKFSSYINYYLASRGAGNPKYNFVFIDFCCSKCKTEHKAFFYTRFEEKYFPVNEREFFLAEIDKQELGENIDGVYDRDTCQVFMKKLLIRWHILKNITYLVVPFIGNPYQTPLQRLELLGEFLSPLHPYKTLWVTRPTTISQIKADFDADNGKGAFDILDKNGQINPILKSVFTKTDFHAKFYCGISEKGVEVLSGSHNLHGGTYMENLMFKIYPMDKFIDRYLFQINVVPAVPPNNTPTDALIFNNDENLQVKQFTNNATSLVATYIK